MAILALSVTKDYDKRSHKIQRMPITCTVMSNSAIKALSAIFLVILLIMVIWNVGIYIWGASESAVITVVRSLLDKLASAQFR